jgi:hypothetical protein
MQAETSKRMVTAMATAPRQPKSERKIPVSRVKMTFNEAPIIKPQNHAAERQPGQVSHFF